MRYISTRGRCEPVTGAEAILNGLAPDGGLYVPETIPHLPDDFAAKLDGMDYPQRAAYILSMFLPEFGDLEPLCRDAYARFDGHPAPVTEHGGVRYLELWHGPTCAFKDMALQVLPRLVARAKDLTGEKRDVCILTATSGDTGKAALEGFRDVAGTRVLVFYPEEGVSDIQKLQMVTQEGSNVCVCSVKGDFDDAQTGVKKAFARNTRNDILLTSANSINLGRLLPQIVYYVSAYVDMTSKPGAVLVPTGNFGNILAALYAKRMGVPLGRLVCVSNANNVLTDVINGAVYDRNRPLVRTISPSMDILVSSNFERAVYLLSGCDSDYTRINMEQLSQTGRYELRPDVAAALRDTFDAHWCTDLQAGDCIRRVYKESGYLLDPHTATAAYFAEKYPNALVVSTAHPGKFLTALDELAQYVEMPAPLRGIGQKPCRFTDSVQPDGIGDYVGNWLM